DELGRAEGHVAALEHLLDQPPLAQLPERVLRGTEERREGGEPLAGAELTLAPLAEVRRYPRLHPAAALDPEHEQQREYHGAADEQGEDQRADRRVGGGGQQPGGRSRG